jgi:hypothetical protein
MVTKPQFDPLPPWLQGEQVISLLTSILAALQPSGTGAPPPTGATLTDVLNTLNKILAIQQNARAIQTIDVPVTIPNMQIQYTSLTIPDGFSLTVLSHPNNNAAGLILVAPKNGNLQYNVVSLRPGQFVKYQVNTSDALYIVGTIVGDIVILSSELK